LAAEGYGDYGEIQEYLDRAEQTIFAIGEQAGGASAVTLGSAISSAFKKLSARFESGRSCDGLETGFHRFDRILGGLRDGELTIVAARPGMGKTSFILNLAANVARPKRFEKTTDPNDRWEEPGVGVVIFSLEMPNEQLANRMLCCEAKVNIGKLNGGSAGVSDWRLLTITASEISPLPVWLRDAPGATLLDVRSLVRRIQASLSHRADGVRRLGLVIVDYLQLMRGSGKAGNREQEISELSRGLKGLAKEFSVPVIALSQLNRQVETRADKRPMISDLRESGAIEQDADNIVFLYRDEYYTKELCKCPGTVEVIVAKQRNGPTGMAMHKWSGEFTRFDNLPDGEFSE
jgi:replicative DNA helicase